jgi:hypothetical protein
MTSFCYAEDVEGRGRVAEVCASLADSPDKFSCDFQWH